jgi:4-carboxymuconolactone decarboxylase
MRKVRTLLAAGILGASFVSAPIMADDGARAGSGAQPQRQAAQAAQAESDQAQNRRRASEILHQMLSPEIAGSMAAARPTGGFGGEMSRLAFENAYVQLWARPGLTLKERSLITISILIALGNEKELAIHMASGLRNGLTRQELEEVIYHSTAYAGFPRASDALAVATTVVAQGTKPAQ